MGARSGERELVVVLVLVLVVAVVVVVVLRFSKEGHLLLQILCDDPDDILLDRHVLEVEQLAVTRGHRHCPRRRSAGRSRKSEKLPARSPALADYILHTVSGTAPVSISPATPVSERLTSRVAPSWFRGVLASRRGGGTSILIPCFDHRRRGLGGPRSDDGIPRVGRYVTTQHTKYPITFRNKC